MSDGRKAWAEELEAAEWAERLQRFTARLDPPRLLNELMVLRGEMERVTRADLSLTMSQHLALQHVTKALQRITDAKEGRA